MSAQNNTLHNISALVGGTIFGAGLVVSGMTDPQKVLAFLTLGPGWDPALIVVMGSAVVTAAIGFWILGGRAQPLFDSEFHTPQATQIDRRLLLGAGLFGLGWGTAGFCPGPGIVGLLTLDMRAVVFMLAFIAGLYGYEKLLAPRPSANADAVTG